MVPQSKLRGSFPIWRDGLDAARDWLVASGVQTTFLFEQNRNLGDTLHLTPIIRHYRLTYPDAAIAFVVGAPYAGAHEFNPDIDALFTVPSLEVPDRIALRKHLLTFDNITLKIAPSIFPYGAVWPELTWSHANIATQYFANAGIPNQTPVGGRKLIVQITDGDRAWAKSFMAQHRLTKNRTCAMEYNSYSAQPVWRTQQFQKFIQRCEEHGIKCISLAGKNEPPIPGSINGTGTTWRQTVALANEIGAFVGVGSGITMLMASAEQVPKILEIAVDDPVNMLGCGYADSLKVVNINPQIVADHLWFKVLNGQAQS